MSAICIIPKRTSIEAALKFARKHARAHQQGTAPFEKSRIVAFTSGFHGRSMGALSVTYKSAYREPFAPLVPGITFAEYNDLDSAAGAIDREAAGKTGTTDDNKDDAPPPQEAKGFEKVQEPDMF